MAEVGFPLEGGVVERPIATALEVAEARLPLENSLVELQGFANGSPAVIDGPISAQELGARKEDATSIKPPFKSTGPSKIAPLQIRSFR
jgi:hypothetical protein